MPTARKTPADEAGIAVTAVTGAADVSAPTGGGFDLFAEFCALGRDNVNAVVRTSNALFEGCQDITWACFDAARTSVTDGFAGTRALMTCTSTREFAALQGELALDGLETFGDESRRIGFMSARILEQALAPLTARADATAQTLAKPIGT